jgi:membrane-bound lytic murein transglycosylase B
MPQLKKLYCFFSLFFAFWIYQSLDIAISDEINDIDSTSPKNYAIQKLASSGVSPSFVSLLLKKYNEEERNKIVQLNVLGFLGHADYSGHYSKLALKKCIKFIKKHKTTLKRAENLYGVPSEAIASLLWVETKHGATLGTYSIPGVFFSLIQSDHPLVMQNTIESLRNRIETPTEEVIQKTIKRSKDKATWALQELKSLEEIYKIQEKKFQLIRGSYAGAFGLPQFIPSSYVQWAKPKNRLKVPNLFDPNDAIVSVAYYLKQNGWQQDSLENQRAALFHYNRAQGYVDVILRLAQGIKNEAKY